MKSLNLHYTGTFTDNHTWHFYYVLITVPDGIPLSCWSVDGEGERKRGKGPRRQGIYPYKLWKWDLSPRMEFGPLGDLMQTSGGHQQTHYKHTDTLHTSSSNSRTAIPNYGHVVLCSGIAVPKFIEVRGWLQGHHFRYAPPFSVENLRWSSCMLKCPSRDTVLF